jgi:hypothetical protein
VVADRGMISAETMPELEAYIMGVRERSDKLVRDLVLADTAPFVPLVMKKRSKEIDYEAKTVKLAGAALHRLPQPAGGREGCRRPPIVAALARQLAKGDRALVGNNGYRATPARCAPAPECRSSRRSRLCDGTHRRRQRPGKPHRYRRIWRQRQDLVLASASNESGAV